MSTSTKAPVLSLVERRPPQQTPWSPVELLEELLADVKAGKVVPLNMMVFFTEQLPDQKERPRTWSANVSRAEAIAYCTLEIQRTLEDWRVDG